MFSDTEAENDRETGRNRSQDRKTGGFFPKEATGKVDGKKGVDYNEKAKNPGKNGRNERRENGMTIQEKAEKAVDLKLHHGYNCTQAVTAALADDTDLTEGQLVHLAAGFCAGMGNMEATCGALIGAGMIAGASTEGKGTVKYTRALLEAIPTTEENSKKELLPGAEDRYRRTSPMSLRELRPQRGTGLRRDRQGLRSFG